MKAPPMAIKLREVILVYVMTACMGARVSWATSAPSATRRTNTKIRYVMRISGVTVRTVTDASTCTSRAVKAAIVQRTVLECAMISLRYVIFTDLVSVRTTAHVASATMLCCPVWLPNWKLVCAEPSRTVIASGAMCAGILTTISEVSQRSKHMFCVVLVFAFAMACKKICYC